MSSRGESASPGVSFSPGFLAAILEPGLIGASGAAAALGSSLAAFAAALAFCFSSRAMAASCALVSGLTGLPLGAGAGLPLATAFTGLPLAGAGFSDFLAGTDR